MPDEVKYSSTRFWDIQIGPAKVLEVDNFARRHIGLLKIVKSENSLDDRV